MTWMRAIAGAGPTNSIEYDGRALVERLGGRWTGNGGLCHCPAHDDRSPSLSVRQGRSRLLFHCFAGCSAAEVLRALERLGLPGAGAESSQSPKTSDPESSTAAAARRIWAASQSIAGTAAASYLAERGLQCFSPQLRFNARTPQGARPLTNYRPALIAAVRDETGLVGIHRTFLNCRSFGAAALKRERAGLGRFGTGAVRLGGIGPRLGLAEGIETALSASDLFGIPCWATLGTERFKQVSIAGPVEELHLFLDHDEGGERAEFLARETFAHFPIKVHVPPRAREDWNDVLRASRRR